MAARRHLARHHAHARADKCLAAVRQLTRRALRPHPARRAADWTAHAHIFRTGAVGSAAHQFIAQLEESRGSSQICLAGRFATLAEAETELERARQRQRLNFKLKPPKGGSRAK
jgi:hypothetical protein